MVSTVNVLDSELWADPKGREDAKTMSFHYKIYIELNHEK